MFLEQSERNGNKYESMDWIPYLRYISHKPRPLKNSGIYDMIPSSMQIYMDGCESKDRGKILKVLTELTENSGFTSAIATVNKAIEHQVTDPDSLISLYRRIYGCASFTTNRTFGNNSKAE